MRWSGEASRKVVELRQVWILTMDKKIEELRRKIQEAAEKLRHCEAALRLGESSRAHDLICESIAHLERLLHDAKIPPQT